MKLLFHALAAPPATDRTAAGGDDVDRGLAWLESALTHGLSRRLPTTDDPAQAVSAARFVLAERVDLSRGTGDTPPHCIACGPFAIGVRPRDARGLGIVALPDLLESDRRRWHNVAHVLNVLGRLEEIAHPHASSAFQMQPRGGAPDEILDDGVQALIRHLDRHHAGRILAFFDHAGERAAVLEAMVRAMLSSGASPSTVLAPGQGLEYGMIPALHDDGSALAAGRAAGSRLRDCIGEIVVPQPALERARRVVERLSAGAKSPRVHAALPAWELLERDGLLEVVAWKPQSDGRT